MPESTFFKVIFSKEVAQVHTEGHCTFLLHPTTGPSFSTFQSCCKIGQKHEASSKDSGSRHVSCWTPILPPQTGLQDSLHIYCCLDEMTLFGMPEASENMENHKAVSPSWKKNYQSLPRKNTEKLELQTRAQHSKGGGISLPEKNDYKARVITKSGKKQKFLRQVKTKLEILKTYRIKSRSRKKIRKLIVETCCRRAMNWVSNCL